MRFKSFWIWIILVTIVSAEPVSNKLGKLVKEGTSYEILANARRTSGSSGPSIPGDICSINVKGEPDSMEGDDPIIQAVVQCGASVLYDNKAALSTLKAVDLDHGISLFKDTPYGGFSFVYLSGTKDITLNNVLLENLIAPPGRTMDAPMAVSDVSLDGGTNWQFHFNRGGKFAGALLIIGTSEVDITRGDFFSNVGDEVGCVRVNDASTFHLDDSTVEANKGRRVGGIFVEGKSIAFGQSINFFDNEAEEEATAIYITATATGLLDKCNFYGKRREDDFYEYLLDQGANDDKVKSYKLPNSAAVKVDGKTAVIITQSDFANNTATYGSVVGTEKGVITVQNSKFTGNAAFSGAGVFVEGTRGSYARVMNCEFKENLARYGGGMVVVGNNSFAIDTCQFRSNMALRGAAVWGDYSNSDASNGGCGRREEGSRMDIQESEFENNVASESGGAFFIKCTDIVANRTTFVQNKAKGSGGAIYAEDVFNIVLLDSSLDGNTADENGGGIFAKNTNDIDLRTTQIVNNIASLSGGAIYSDKGHGILVDTSIIQNNLAEQKEGGAIYSIDVDEISAKEANLASNTAGSTGGAFSVNNLQHITLFNLNLTGNKADDLGGAIQVTGGAHAKITNLMISNMKTKVAPVSLSQMGDLIVADITFEDNTADDKCGALQIDGASNVLMYNMNFQRNKAKNAGGSLCLFNAETSLIRDTIFDANMAGEGGAISMRSNKEIHMFNVQLNNNFAEANGGAIQGDGVKAFLFENSILLSNKAKRKGGAVYLTTSSMELKKSQVKDNYVGSKATFTKPSVPDVTNSTVSSSPEVVVASEASLTNAIESNQAGEVIGIVYVSGGESFKSTDTVYEHNEADVVGGGVAVESMDLVFIQYDKFLNGTSYFSGGCIYANNIKNFSIWDTHMQHCKSKSGGAWILEGSSHGEGGYNKFVNNTAEKGGAFLCKGMTDISMEATNFSYNVAGEGATASIECTCNINFETSIFYREKENDDIGDFFHTTKGCGSINSNGCEFIGKMDSTRWSMFYWILIGVVCAALLCFFITIILRRRRSPKSKAKDDTKKTPARTGNKAPLIPKSKQRQSESESTEESSYYTDDDEESESVTSEEHVRRPKLKQTWSIVYKSGAEESSEIESDESDALEEPVDKMERGLFTPFPPPIGIRTPKEARAVVRKRHASLGNINDGAGPSTVVTEDVLPPMLPDRLSLSLSMDESPSYQPQERPAHEDSIQEE